MKQRILLILLFASGSLLSQTDSLIGVYKKTKTDTGKLNLINKISYSFEQTNLDSAVVWAKKGFVLSEKISDNKGIGQFYNHKGRLNLYTQKYDSAIFYFKKSFGFFEKANFIKGMISSNNNIGAVYAEIGNNEEALKYHFNNVEIGKKAEDTESVANSYVNIGNAYNQMQNYYLSVQNILKAIPLYEKLKLEKPLGTCYYNLAVSHFHLKNYKKATELCLKSNTYFKNSNTLSQLPNNYSLLSNIAINLKEYDDAIVAAKTGTDLASKNSNVYALFFLYENIAQAHRNKKELDSALLYSNKAVSIAYEFSYDVFKLKSFFVKGITLYDRKDYKNAILFLDTSLTLAKAQNNISFQSDCNYYLSMCYKGLSKPDIAYDYLVASFIMKDTIFESTNARSILELQTLFETEKKELQIKNQSLEIESGQKENEAKSKMLLFVGFGLFAVAVFAFIAFKNYRKTKKQNVIISQQKQEVELKNEEITHQKELVDEKQKEIIDSINYAKRIQQAVLTGEDVWNKISKEHFILFKPKDIVSGDFYWAYNTPNNRSVFALADCTGHGVPGGFMSMLGNSFLNEIVVENKIFKASEILNKLRSKIIAALHQKGGTDQKDGMDISLCVWNKLDNTLEFSGANNPIWIIRKTIDSNGIMSKQLQEYKADKMPIGTYLEIEKPFTSAVIQLQKDDVIYLCTDGYADQFGGEKGKKFKYKPLMEILLKISDDSMMDQKQQLEDAFSNWKKQYDQVDDVCLIGIKV